MQRYVIFFLCSLLGSVVLLSSCGTDTGPKIESGTATETLQIPAGKDFFISAEVSVTFAGLPDDPKTTLMWNEQVRPVAIEAIKGYSINWGLQAATTTSMLVSGVDPMVIVYSQGICDQLKRVVQTGLRENPITQCVIPKLERLRVSDV